MTATRATKEKPCEKAVEIDLASLSREPDALLAALTEMQKAARAVIVERNLLKERLDRELRARYGPRSERSSILGSPGQGLMPFLEAALLPLPPASPLPSPSSSPVPERTAPEGMAEPPAKKRHPGRRAFPASLKRVQVVIPVPLEDQTCLCCRQPMRKIGEDTSSRLEYEPGSLSLIEELRDKFACVRCPHNGVLSAEPGPTPISRGLAGPGLLAHVTVSKYADHLPLHRMERIFARLGVPLPRSTLGDWIGGVADLLEPVYAELRRELLKSVVLAADESKIPVQGGERGKTHTSWLWVYPSAERKVTLFDYARSRGAKEPLRVLEGWKGTLLTDDYGAYKPCHERGMREAACWAHVRRKFVEARATDPPRCDWMIAAIARLYAIESRARDLAPEARAELRRAHAPPILSEIRAWLDREALSVLPRGAVGEAVAHARRRWPALLCYLEDGRIEIDNNRSERAIRDAVIGRKNWLFAGSDAGGRRAAIIYSVLATCKENGVEPWAYLKDALQRLPTFRGDIASLTPLAWKPTQAPAAAAPTPAAPAR